PNQLVAPYAVFLPSKQAAFAAPETREEMRNAEWGISFCGVRERSSRFGRALEHHCSPKR
ncbi:MAG: hypothetical protein PHU85_06160, partial [Phycisphaerae bacterium]|nr:hypothetical protein [Phycisphaerae bacterium]